MTPEQEAAAQAWLDSWVAPLIANASVFTRGSYEAFIAAHRDELVQGIGNAVLSAPVVGSTPEGQGT